MLPKNSGKSLILHNIQKFKMSAQFLHNLTGYIHLYYPRKSLACFKAGTENHGSYDRVFPLNYLNLGSSETAGLPRVTSSRLLSGQFSFFPNPGMKYQIFH